MSEKSHRPRRPLPDPGGPAAPFDYQSVKNTDDLGAWAGIGGFLGHTMSKADEAGDILEDFAPKAISRIGGVAGLALAGKSLRDAVEADLSGASDGRELPRTVGGLAVGAGAALKCGVVGAAGGPIAALGLGATCGLVGGLAGEEAVDGLMNVSDWVGDLFD